MNKPWWEDGACFLCDYWWVLLLIILLLAAGFIFGRGPIMERYFPTEVPTPVLGSGDIQITLRWNSLDDLDLWVTDPQGERIYFENKNSASGGELDYDTNLDCQNRIANPAVENIYWPEGDAPQGKYKVEVNYFKNCDGVDKIDYQVIVKQNNEILHNIEGTLNQETETHTVVEFVR